MTASTGGKNWQERPGITQSECREYRMGVVIPSPNRPHVGQLCVREGPGDTRTPPR
ncbi:hypothetical protein [Nitrosomonas sp. Nm58]|uniref:hypothetical protein n=1 Tax=Nitrosomonas sp. Nm58 TaxID=200126 RepID=UPI0015A58725|nr:hypothetical protein [Nitrosomonas sp. Nm58]